MERQAGSQMSNGLIGPEVYRTPARHRASLGRRVGERKPQGRKLAALAESWPAAPGRVRTWGLTGREVALSAGPLLRPSVIHSGYRRCTPIAASVGSSALV